MSTPLTEKFLVEGLYDIKHSTNPYGIARRLIENVLQYRHDDMYAGIEAGFLPDSDYLINKALYHAAKTNNRQFVDYFLSHGAYDMNYGISGAVAGGHSTLVSYLLFRSVQHWQGHRNPNVTHNQPDIMITVC